jgi:hypothetical protein
MTVFVAIQLLKIANRPLTLIDDGYFALIARTLAETGSYALPWSSSTVPRVFDPAIGVGPALILPGALTIKLFGNAPWVPGCTVLVIFVAQLLALTTLLYRSYCNAALAYVAISIVALVALTPPRLDYYYAYVGEAPMIGFLIIGAAILCTSGNIIAAGLSFALAILTKQAAIYPLAGMLLIWCAAIWRTEGAFRRAILLVSTITTPVIVFEAVKLAVLGWHGYLIGLAETLSFLHNLVAPADRWKTFLATVKWEYCVPVEAAIAFSLTLAVAVALRWRASLLLLTIAGALAAFCWYGFDSIMLPRYLWPAVALAAFAFALPVLSLSGNNALVFALTMVGLLTWRAGAIAFEQVQSADANYRIEQNAVIQLALVNKVVPTVGVEWISFFDIAYLLPSGTKWYIERNPDRLASTPSLVIFNKDWTYPSAVTRALSYSCQNVLPKATRYAAYACAPDRWSFSAR